MGVSDNFIAHWYFHLPNLFLAAMIYTLIGRYVLELAFEAMGGRKDAVILNVFRSITDPVLRCIRVFTPAMVPNGLVVVFAVIWLMAARIFLFWALRMAGVKIGIPG